ncbi:MAG: aldehyde ferredoxin oxidoreductase N-terminal domain-containing protein [Chloroflexota bacterium]
MVLYGFAGNVLYVDLTTGKTRREALDPQLVEDFLGGWGIALRMIYDLVPPDTEPLAPENAIILVTGPFNGTFVPASSRVMALYKGPLNNTYTPSSGGGAFAAMLKSSGYDFVVLTGRAGRPVYLKICDDDVTLEDAGDLWGAKDIFETVFELRRRYEPCSVIAIGPSGENLVNISVTQIDQGGGGLGEGGLCAVMGSKNLKAVVAVEGTREVRVADPRRLQRLTDKMLKDIMTYPLRQEIITGGSMAMTAGWAGSGGRFYGNYGGVEPLTENDKEQSLAMLELHKTKRKHLACPSCPMGDKDRVDYEGITTYDTAIMSPISGYGPKEGYRELIEYTDAANRLGIDKLHLEPLVQFMAYLYQTGQITKADTGGLEIKDDAATLTKLVKMIAYREGFGDVLADGIVGAARRLGKGLERYAAHGKGYSRLQDPRMRGLGTMQFSQVVNPRGSVVVQGGMGAASYNSGWPVDKWVKSIGKIAELPEEVARRVFSADSFSVARLTRYPEDFFSLMNCLGLCYRLYIYRFYNIRTIAAFYAAVTGIERTPAELFKAGEKAWNLYKLLNVRAGQSRKDDKPPEVWFTPVKETGGREIPFTDYYRTKVITREDFEGLLDEYYDERGWDKKTGTPTPEKLRELGLGDL